MAVDSSRAARPVTTRTETVGAQEQSAPPQGMRARSDRAIANLFLLPTILLLMAMNLFPLFWSLFLSFNKYKADAPRVPAVWGGTAGHRDMRARPLALPPNKCRAAAPRVPAVWVGNANYREMLASPDVWQSFRITAGFV